MLLGISIALLTGCVTPEHNIKVPENFWQDKTNSVAIAKTKFAEKPCLNKHVDDGGLLSLAINAAVTHKFDKYLERADMDWYYEELPQKFVDEFKKRKISAQIYATNIEPKQKKNTNVLVQMDGNKLLTFELQNFGAIRHYYNLFPKGAPKAYCVIKGELINRQDNKVLWRQLAHVEEPVHGDWDQPPSYPNFTQALKEAVHEAQEILINSFFSGH